MEDFFKLRPEELPASFMDICPMCWMPKKSTVNHDKVCTCGFVAEPGMLYFTEIPDPEDYAGFVRN